MTKKSSSLTIRDIARQSGVSVATVSRYINHSAPVSAEIAARIEQVMTELHYAPHAAARTLATRKTRAIGLLLTNLHNDFFGPLLSGIETVVRSRGYNLLVATTISGTQSEQRLPLGPHNTDGLLVFADSVQDDDLAELYARSFPVITIHRTPPPGVKLPCVTVENKAATRKLVEHLIEAHGRRRIVLMQGPPKQEDAYWREAGYRAALEACGLPFDPGLVLRGEFDRQIAYASLDEYLRSGKADFDAVFAGDDDAAVGVLDALQTNGRRVPEDVAVAGFDDQSLAAFLNPPLTTVRAPTERVGQIAAANIFELIAGRPVEAVTLLPTELVLRRSCGCLE